MEWRRWRYILPLRLRSIFRGGAVEQELDGELRFHLACKVEEEMTRGLDAHEAHYQALRAIDGLEQRKEEIRDMRRVRWFNDFAADLRYVIRALGYGLVAYAASRRTREIGIRMAVGADAKSVLRMILRQALVLVASGVAIGLVLGLAAERGLNAVFETSGTDVGAYLLILPSLVCVTMMAAFIPARRASRIEPTRALRYE